MIMNYIVKGRNKIESILINIINWLFFLSLSLILTVGRISPFHNISNIVYLIVLLLMIIYVYFYGRFTIDKYVLIIIFLNLSTFISSLLHHFSGETFTLNVLTISTLPIYFYFKNQTQSRKIALSLVLISYLVFILFFLFIYFKELISLDFSKRLGGVIGNENDVATYLLTGYAIILYHVLKRKLYLVPFLLLSLLEMFSTGSRAGILNIVLITTLTVFLLWGRKNILRFCLFAIILIAGSYLLLLIPNLKPVKDRFDGLFAELILGNSSDQSAENRLNLINQSIEVFMRSPIFGNGKNFAKYYTFDGGVAHNAYVELAAGYGVLTLIFFVSLFVYPIQLNRKSTLTKIIISSFLVFYLTLSGYYYKPPYLIIPLLSNLNNIDLGL